jgi:Flp pilus assembly pilin Flp
MKSPKVFKQETGAGIVEYGLIVALIAIVSLTSVTALGHSTSGSLTSSAQSLSHDENADTETTTTTEAGSDTDSTTTTVADNSGVSDGSGSDDTEGSEDSGGPGGSTTTTAPQATTTTTTASQATTTTTTAPDYPTAVAAVKGKVSVTYGYVDKKVVVVDTQTEGDWSVKVTTESADRIDLEFTNTKTGSVVTTEGYIKKGELETKVKEKAK